MEHNEQYFDAMFAQDADPWRFQSRWYEARKRAMTLACLTRPLYASAFEPGCANGELSAALAPRCERLIVSDGSHQAVALARVRTAKFGQVEVRRAWIPDEWPAESFDLIVFSELGYFLSAKSLASFIRKARSSLRKGGSLLACHWRRGSSDCEFNGDDVHRRLEADLEMPRLCQIVESDFRIELWCDDERSVAQREGFA